MKLKILVAIVEKILGVPDHGDEPRADMYLPMWLLAFGLVLLVAAIGCVIGFIASFSIGWIIAAVICALIGVAAVMCWKNQTIRVIDEETFEYTTFLGNKKVYSFSDIHGLKVSSDSMTLFVGDGKVHIESSALISKRLSKKINAGLNQAAKKAQASAEEE